MGGIIMKPLLLCSSCECTARPFHGGVRAPDGVVADLICGECREPMMLVTYGVVEDKATLTDLAEYSLRRATGTWWQ